MLLATLLCTKGHDNSARYAVVSVISLVLTFLSGLIFAHSVFAVILTSVYAVISTLSGVRRSKNAALPVGLSLILPAVLLMIAMSQYLLAPWWLVLLLALVAVAAIVLLTVKPSTHQSMPFQQGYYGPKLEQNVSLGGTERRREPVIGGRSMDVDDLEPDHDISYDMSHEQQTEQSQPFDEAEPQPSSSAAAYKSRFTMDLTQDKAAADSGSVTELFKAMLSVAQQHKVKLLWVLKGGGATVVVVAIGYGVWAMTQSDTDDVTVMSAPETNTVTEVEQRISVKMPDGFWLQKQGDILIVRWLGEKGDAQNLWQLSDAKGDKSCATLEFNNRKQYRPISVDLMADSGTEARFSPLDNAEMIKDIAMRGSFTLCGYQFSLKGSQAAMATEAEFREYL